MDKEISQKVGIGERISYGFTAVASNLVMAMVLNFLLFFYTDVFMVPAAIVGTILLVSKIWDAVNDPIMGALADKTNTRWGKYRPYLLWFPIPVAIATVLVFSAPDFSLTGKIVYIVITYNILMMLFTAVDVPTGALMATMTQDSSVRNSLGSFISIGLLIGQLILVSMALPLVGLLSGGNEARGWQLAALVFGVLAAIFWLIPFFKVRERVKPATKQSYSFKDGYKSVVKSGPWWIFFFLGVCAFVAFTLRMDTAMYYFTYNVGNQDLATMFLMATVISMLIGVIVSPFIARKIGKKNTLIIAGIGAPCSFAAFFFIDPQNTLMVFILNIIGMIFLGLATPLIYAMTGDIVDYCEWRTHTRAAGITSSSLTFGMNLGIAIGGALTAWMLSAFGYVPNVEQTVRSLLGIKLIISILPAVVLIIFLILILIYPINEKKFAEIISDLEKRRLES